MNGHFGGGTYYMLGGRYTQSDSQGAARGGTGRPTIPILLCPLVFNTLHCTEN